jgi:elongation factor Ts
MSVVSSELVRELRERSGAGIMECKRALAEAHGDLEAALVVLRKKGLAAAAKKAGRVASEGMVGSYIHAGGKIGVLVEINCETDFVARTDDFQNLVKEIAMQIAAASPRFVRRDDVPPAVLEAERSIYQAQAANSGKPAPVIAKIVEGKVEKFFTDACLLEQPYIKDPDKSVAQLVNETIAKLGENLVVRRFARFALGEQSAAES